MRVAEAEFAFRLGRELCPRARPYSRTEVLAALDSLHPAIEIPDSRYADFTRVGAPQLIADDACAHFFVLGSATSARWREIDLVEHEVVAKVTGAEGTPPLIREGKGHNVLGDPLAAMTWLVNELSGLAIGLVAGQIVTTGTCLVPLPVAPGDRVDVDFGVLGSASLQIL
jgi:2-keto-4-pentenoate hydratase